MGELKLLKLHQVTGGDTYEIAYASSYPGTHWSKDSLYLSDVDRGIQLLAPYLNRVFPHFSYYGPQKITLSQWHAVEQYVQQQGTDWPFIQRFFCEVEEWLKKGNGGSDFFWILGI